MEKKPKYMNFVVQVMRFMSLLDLEEHSSCLFKTLSLIWQLISCLVIIYTVIFSFVDLYLRKYSDLLELTPILLNLSVYITVATRFLMFTTSKQSSTRLVKLMTKTFKYTTETQLEEKTMYDYIRRANLAGLIWFIIDHLAGQTYAFSPVLTSGNRALPMRLWRPYDPYISPNYELTYCFELLCQTVLVANIISDIFWCTMAYITSGQFDLLAWEFEHVLYTPLVFFNIPKETILDFKVSLPSYANIGCRENEHTQYSHMHEIMQSDAYGKETAKHFKRIVDTHNALLTFIDEMEKYWSVKLLIMVIMAQSYLTFMLFIVITSNEITTIVQALGYVAPIMLQICIISACGEQLSKESRKLQAAIFGSPWYFCSIPCRTLVKIVQNRADREVFISLGGFAPVNLRSLTWLMKSAFSYLAVLRETAGISN